MSTIALRYIAYVSDRQIGAVRCALRADVNKTIRGLHAEELAILGVGKTVNEAMGFVDDFEKRCRGCGRGRGRFCCSSCAAASLEGQLRASVQETAAE